HCRTQRVLPHPLGVTVCSRHSFGWGRWTPRRLPTVSKLEYHLTAEDDRGWTHLSGTDSSFLTLVPTRPETARNDRSEERRGWTRSTRPRRLSRPCRPRCRRRRWPATPTSAPATCSARCSPRRTGSPRRCWRLLAPTRRRSAPS